MASYQESQKKRKIALRKFNDYYNSFIDDHGEEIVGEKTKIRALIEEIRKLNRHLAENDSLFDETLVEQFNTDAHRLAKFLNETQSMNIVNDKVEEPNNDKRPTAETRRNQKQEIHNIENDNNFDMIQTDKNIDALLNNYYINRLKLTNTNWLDYYPQVMEFIVENRNLPDMNTRMVYLRKTIENNPKACRLIMNQCEITDAIEILKQHFGIWNGMEQEKYVQKLIKEYYFSKNEKDDEKNFRKLFLISLHIVYTVHGDLKKKYLNVIIRKLPQSFYCQSPYFFLLMIRAKLRIYDCPFVLKPGTYEELEQLADRLIDDRTICPICFKYQKHIRCHRIVKCRFLEMIIRRYGGNQRNLLANRSASDQNSIDQNTTEQSINNENYDDEATIDQKSSESERYSTEQNDNDEQHLECKVEESPKNKSNNIPDLFTQQSSEIETSKSPDQENIKIIPITLICSKRGPINRIKAFINDPDGRNNDAMIEFGYLKSLNIDAKIDYETVSDLRTIIHIVGYVEIKIAIGFLIRTIKFAVFSSLNEEQTVRISTDILKQFSLISPPTRFEQRFAQIINCSIDGKNDVDEPKRETLRKFFDANFLINSAIKFDTNESLKISFNINDYNFDNEYFINYDNQIYYDLDVAIEDRSLTELKFQKAHIYLLKGDETDTDDDHNMDSMLIKFDRKNFFILIQLHGSDEEQQRRKIIEECRQLLNDKNVENSPETNTRLIRFDYSPDELD